MKEEKYKQLFIKQHGEVAYAEKLVQNAIWRNRHPERLAAYKKKRSGKTGAASKVVILLSDLHIGASSVDVDQIRELSKQYWSKSPIILLGDICDLGLDRGMNWDNRYGPQEQIDFAREIFKPLNILGHCEGNHGNRIWEKVGLNPFIEMFGMDPSHTIKINGRDIYFSHGTSVAQNMFNEHQKYVKWVDSDVVALGHSHALARISYLRGSRLCHLVRTGGFLGRSKYVEDAGFNPLLRGWAEYNTETNLVALKALSEDGEVFDI